MQIKRRHEAGSVILLLLIFAAVLGGGYYYLRQSCVDSEAEARAFGREIIQKVAVEKNLKFLHSAVNPDHRIDFPPPREEGFVNMFKMLGTPTLSWQIAGDVVFENRYFSPRGKFRCVLTYPDRHATVMLNVSRPHGPWQLDWLAVTYERELPP